MNLRQLILGTSLVVGLAGCASVMHRPFKKGCYMQGDLRMCTDFVGNGQITFYKGVKDGKLFCGMRSLYPEKWFIIVDSYCDGFADIYQEGDDDKITDHLWRKKDEESYLWKKKDEERFKKEFDIILKEAKSKVWKEE